MSDADFRKLVAHMRHAQREFFRTRDRHILEQSKRLERMVDDELEPDQDKQQKLF